MRCGFWVLLAGCLVLSTERNIYAEDLPGAEPDRVFVEGQPLAANVRRVITTLKTLGAPLEVSAIKSLDESIESQDSDRIQRDLDAHVLIVVQLNPEERVKVRRGPAKATLQQHGFTPVLVKILNGSTATKRMRIVSPQAGAPYAGVAKLSMQRQQSLELIENENPNHDPGRFLAMEMFAQPPMTDRLSGLEVEYAIALILSTEAGQREATIGIDFGQGEQDLGFRGEVPILFSVRPSISVRLSVVDHDGSPTMASLIIRDGQGHVYPPQSKRLSPDFFFQPQIYRADGETILLPPGEFSIQSGRGPEYWTTEQSQRISAPPSVPKAARQAPAESQISIQLKRWVDPQRFGFYSGDHHIHAAGCAHYTSPTEGVDPADMFRQVKGEALNVGCVLTWGPCYGHQRQFFSAKPDNISEPLTILKYDLEISGFGSQALGHVCLLNLQDQTFPGSDGTETKGWPTWTTPVMKWAKEQGGVTGYAHSASGLAIDPAAAAKRILSKFDQDQSGALSAQEAMDSLLPEPFFKIDSNENGGLDEQELLASHNRVADQLPNLAIPEMNGVGAMEICVTTAEGVCDFISAMDTRRIQEWNTWYHLLNCGFPLKVSGETDFPCMSSRRVGQGRVYVKLHEAIRDLPLGQSASARQINFSDWCRGLARGQSYVSDGFAHALDFRVNDEAPGNTDVSLKVPGRVTVKAKVAFAPQTPITVAQGTDRSTSPRLAGDTVELHGPRSDQIQSGGERLIEVVFNGKVVTSKKVPADGQIHDLEFDATIPHSGWMAIRQFPQLHTNPVNILVGDQPIRASRASARWCEQTIERLWQNRERNIAVAERDEAKQTFERAKARYREIALQSVQD
jgi:hypothetical protein